MKRLYLLAIVAVLTAANVGCNGCSWFRRGQQCDTCPSGGPYSAAPMSSVPGNTYEVSPGPG